MPDSVNTFYQVFLINFYWPYVPLSDKGHAISDKGSTKSYTNIGVVTVQIDVIFDKGLLLCVDVLIWSCGVVAAWVKT
jgi:hypothetical protein